MISSALLYSTEHHAKSLTWLLAISSFRFFNLKKVPNLRIYAMHVKVDLSVQISFPKFPKKVFKSIGFYMKDDQLF